jgi:polyisoprenoid-binding protein YceI
MTKEERMTQQLQQLQQHPGIQVPGPGTYTFDPAHTEVGFWARHLMVTKVRGRFNQVSGTIEVGDTPEASSVDVTIGAASIDTDNEGRDEHLRSPDFLDVERFPHLRYRSTRVERTGETTGRIEGELTIRDVTLPVTLDAEFNGMSTDPWGKVHTAFSATAEVDREAFGMTWNQALETGGVLVGRTVKIELEVQLVPVEARAAA